MFHVETYKLHIAAMAMVEMYVMGENNVHLCVLTNNFLCVANILFFYDN